MDDPVAWSNRLFTLISKRSARYLWKRSVENLTTSIVPKRAQYWPDPAHSTQRRVAARSTHLSVGYLRINLVIPLTEVLYCVECRLSHLHALQWASKVNAWNESGYKSRDNNTCAGKECRLPQAKVFVYSNLWPRSRWYTRKNVNL